NNFGKVVIIYAILSMKYSDLQQIIVKELEVKYTYQAKQALVNVLENYLGKNYKLFLDLEKIVIKPIITKLDHQANLISSTFDAEMIYLSYFESHINQSLHQENVLCNDTDKQERTFKR